jgi:hypothetical protein
LKPGVTVESEAPNAFILQDAEPSTPPTFYESGQSNAFWSKAHQMAKTAKPHQYLDPNDLVPARRHSSVASALSSDLSSPSNEADDDDVLRCPRCRGTNFRASKTRAGRQRLVCTKCNTVVKS